MTTEQFLAGVDARLTKLEKAIRDTPRPGPVLLSDGTRVGHARRLNARAWARIADDWAGQYPVAEPVKGEAVAA
jgi:hypothetical protein